MDIDELDEEKKLVLKTFREKVQDILDPEKNDDAFLLRWLVARNFNAVKAEAMLRKHVQFMKLNGLNSMEDYVPNKATEYFCTERLGYDKDGSVIRIVHLGGTDIKGLTLSLSKMDSIKFATYVLSEDVKTQRKDRENMPICLKQVYIFDMQDLSWRSIISRTVVQRAIVLLKAYENNHPESLKIVYIVNFPSFFSFIFNWLKTILPESIISKLKLLSPEKMAETIKDHIDPSIVPAAVGGTKIDENGDPNCASMYKVPLNSTVPEDLMLFNQVSVLQNDPLAKKTIVDIGCIFKVETAITEPLSALQWDFQTLLYDIGVGLNYKKDEHSEPQVIFPLHRVDSHLCAESGTFQCAETGIYELMFDNTFSWFTRKELTYKITVLPPDKNYDN